MKQFHQPNQLRGTKNKNRNNRVIAILTGIQSLTSCIRKQYQQQSLERRHDTNVTQNKPGSIAIASRELVITQQQQQHSEDNFRVTAIIGRIQRLTVTSHIHNQENSSLLLPLMLERLELLLLLFESHELLIADDALVQISPLLLLHRMHRCDPNGGGEQDNGHKPLSSKVARPRHSRRRHNYLLASTRHPPRYRARFSDDFSVPRAARFGVVPATSEMREGFLSRQQ